MFAADAASHPVIGGMGDSNALTLLSQLHEAHTAFIYVDVDLGFFAPNTSEITGQTNENLQVTLPSPDISYAALIDTQSSLLYAWLADMLVAMETTPKSTSYGQRQMLKDPDAWSPFREKARSRCVITRPDGPFASSRIYTHSGIFSAVIFRGILFSSEVMESVSHGCFFPTLESWHTFVDSYSTRPDRDKYICWPCPYGHTNPRKISNVPTFWLSSIDLHKKLGSSPSSPDAPSFLTLIKWIQAHRLLNEQKGFPSFGKLNSYLLVVDLVYSSQVKLPSLQEVADATQYLNMGAANGLQKLGLVDHNVSVASAFIQLHHAMEQKVDACRERMGYDMFVTEHSLCLSLALVCPTRFSPRGRTGLID
ncbi:hypothetical protein VKT23_020634 [Stygiomarasmius scandens]|uniref:Uncharacterized protein n=1 Tax=Marasmiellus scandens TaxID=2682957 RepID=A0ABR1ILX1_9AGAR